MSADDPRCCGSGTCIINDEGECWCGQVWNGDRMVAPGAARTAAGSPTGDAAAPPPPTAAD
jgi:hypothetical protein